MTATVRRSYGDYIIGACLLVIVGSVIAGIVVFALSPRIPDATPGPASTAFQCDEPSCAGIPDRNDYPDWAP